MAAKRTLAIDQGAADLIEVFENDMTFLFNDMPASLRPAAVDFVPRLRFNAIAAPGAAGASLRFWQGCGICLADLICSLIAEREFLSDLKRDFCSVNKGPEVEGRFWNYEWLKQAPGGAPVKFEPAVRMHFHAEAFAIFNHLRELCQKFLYYHEHAHIKLGHVTDAKGAGVRALQEFSPVPVISQLPLRRQWELEADLRAFYHLLWVGRDETHRRTAHIPCVNTAAWDSLVFIACDIVFSIMHLAEAGFSARPDERDHPSASARMMHLIVRYVDLIYGDHLSHDSSSKEALFSYIWLDILRNFVPIADITQVMPVTMPDLKCSVFVNDPDAWPVTPTVRELLDCFGQKEIRRSGSVVEVLPWPAFVTKSLPGTAVNLTVGEWLRSTHRNDIDVAFGERLRCGVALSDIKAGALYFHHLLPMGTYRVDERDSSLNKLSPKGLTNHLFLATDYERLTKIQGYKNAELGYIQSSLLLTHECPREVRFLIVGRTIASVTAVLVAGRIAYSIWVRAADIATDPSGEGGSGYEIAVNDLALINTDELSWQQILELRQDPEALKPIRRLRQVLLDDYSNKPTSFIADHVGSHLDAHNAAVAKNGFGSAIGNLTVLLSREQFAANGWYRYFDGSNDSTVLSSRRSAAIDGQVPVFYRSPSQEPSRNLARPQPTEKMIDSIAH